MDFTSSSLSLLLWGGLHPIPEQLAYDCCTIVGWITATTALLWSLVRLVARRQSPPTTTTTTTTTDTTVNHHFHHGGMILSLLVVAGTILVTSHGTWTNRWTLTIPMIPITFGHLCMYCYSIILSKRLPEPKHSSLLLSRILIWALALLTLLCISCAMALSILFPAVELPPLNSSSLNHTSQDGRRHHYFSNIGAIDFYISLPGMSNNGTDVDQGRNTCSFVDEPSDDQKYLPVRLLYPTHQDSKRSWWSSFRIVAGEKGTAPHPPKVPFLNIDTAKEFCAHSMKFGAPEPLKQLDWILHTWRLISLPLSRNAPLRLSGKSGGDSGTIPSNTPKLVVFSHGLGGSMDLYSYQTMSLASAGYIVLSMTHTDGSAPIVPQPHPHRHIPHDTRVLQLHEQGKHAEYELARQSQNAIRTHEYLHAVQYVKQLLASLSSTHGENCNLNETPNHENCRNHDFEYHRHMLQQHWQIPHDDTHSFNGVKNITTYFMGHSFGGVTAMQAAYERPDLVSAIVAYEPAIGWAAPHVCHAMFPSALLKEEHFHNFTTNHTICPPLISVDQVEASTTTLHTFDMLVLNSHEWMNKNWGRAQLLKEMHQRQKLGKNPNLSHHSTIHQSHHNEFSDTSMLTPLWLARPVGLTGPRNPIHTAKEIAQLTLNFLQRKEAHHPNET